MKIKKYWEDIYSFMHSWFIQKPRSLKLLLNNVELYKGETYFPEKKHNSKFNNFFKQVRYILKYDTPEQYFFLYGLDTKRLKEIDTYIHYDYFAKIRISLNHKNIYSDSTCILYNKLYFGIFARAMGMRVAKDVAYIEDEKFYFVQPTVHSVDYEELLTLPNGNYFVKSLSGENGDDIFKITIYNKEILYKGNTINLNDFKKLLVSKKYIIQEQIVQHPKMNELYPGSINTLRIFTVRSVVDNQLYTLPSIVRMGAGGAFIDNGSKGGIMTGVDLNTGKLYPYGLRKPEYGRVAYAHPDTGVQFADFTVPYIKECVDECKKFHNLFPDIHSIGWDVVVTEDGPLFIEGNDNWEIEVPQLYRGIKREFDEYFIGKSK